ncbi:MAG: imidazole glycerol phosphate synthase subunit HisH [Candidatus Omnitrophota bacterium]
MIAVIDYGMGNLRSVQKALEISGARTVITSSPREIKRCAKIVFPGVGAFGESMKELKRRGLVGPIKDAIGASKPFLGLCLGLQLLFEKSQESPGVKGLCVFEGESKRFCFMRNTLKVPHMGWNNIKVTPAHETNGGAEMSPGCRSGGILKGIPKDAYMYFVHSYYVVPEDKSMILTTTGYGINFVSGICKDNVYGFQFHPEKSQDLGLRILKNFVRL